MPNNSEAKGLINKSIRGYKKSSKRFPTIYLHHLNTKKDKI
jgi:hypothetical protein